ncbi:MAG: beta-ketoacyl-[acyl-carrier-protein] synthase family protein [Deltaproteobacteria bacterium]|nr:beta-ketoacyl-[acyl-carrier-protein] synthase family protein [Deltaproteobacteria bacterium]
MRRVVVTGFGIISSIGNGVREVTEALRDGRSGLQTVSELAAAGFRSSVYAPIRELDTARVRKRARQTMSAAALQAVLAAEEAIGIAGLETADLQDDRCGVLIGAALGGVGEVFGCELAIQEQHAPSRAGANGLLRMMSSTASANVANYWGVRGRTISVASSSATGADNIGHAFELVRWGLQDVVLCGGTEEDCWKQVGAYMENSGAVARGSDQRPSAACRPYERDRSGTVLSSGAGVLVLEDLERARRRGAGIIAEVVGYGSANEAVPGLFRLSAACVERAAREALAQATALHVAGVDYVNGHATGTRLGDEIEVQALRRVFGSDAPLLSSTKGQTGHGMSAAGAQEAVYSLLMLAEGFVAPTMNLENVAPECDGVPHVREVLERRLDAVMSLSSGLGGNASSLIFARPV